jgi:hypothetical protein
MRIWRSRSLSLLPRPVVSVSALTSVTRHVSTASVFTPMIVSSVPSGYRGLDTMQAAIGIPRLRATRSMTPGA